MPSSPSTFLNVGRSGAHPNQIAKRIPLAPHDLLDVIVTSVLVDQFHVTRTGNIVTVMTSGAAPSYTLERERVDRVAHELAERYDPHRLTAATGADRPPVSGRC